MIQILAETRKQRSFDCYLNFKKLIVFQTTCQFDESQVFLLVALQILPCLVNCRSCSDKLSLIIVLLGIITDKREKLNLASLHTSQYYTSSGGREF